MISAHPRVDEHQFTGWSNARIRRHARERIAHYSKPVATHTDGERALLVDAWGYVLRRLGRKLSKAACPPSLSKKSRRNR